MSGPTREAHGCAERLERGEARLEDELAAATQRSAALARCAELDPNQPDLWVRAFGELSLALEELRVVNEQLSAVRERAEAEAARYHDLFEFAPDAYVVTTSSGIIRESNLAFAVLLNLSSEYVAGRALASFVPTEQRRAFRDGVSALHGVERIERWPLRLQPDPRAPEIAVEATAAVTRDRSGQPSGLRFLLRATHAGSAANVPVSGPRGTGDPPKRTASGWLRRLAAPRSGGGQR